MSASLRGGKPAVVGIGATEYYKRGTSLPQTQLDMAARAIVAALEDAGLSVEDVDGFSCYANAGGMDLALLAHYLGIPHLRFMSSLTGGGGGSAGSVGQAALAVSAGMASVVVSVMSVQQSAYRLGRNAKSGPYAVLPTSDKDFTIPFGHEGIGLKWSMLARRHMYLYGTTREHLAEIAISTRSNAIRRSSSRMTEPLTLAQYFSARMISDPLCLYDYCLETDGAVAIVTTSAERAADLRQPPVHVLAASIGGAGKYGQGVVWMNSPDDYFTSAWHKRLAQELFAQAQLAPSDVDVALLYDHFTPVVLFQLEDYGFCEVGGAGEFVAAGSIRWPHGSLPVNTHGGHLSESYVMGMTHVKEGVEQIRGTAVNQVPGASVALVTGGPAPSPTSSILLGKP